MLTTRLKSIGTFVITATKSNSLTLSLTGIGLIVITLSTGIAGGITNTNKVVYEIVLQKLKKYKNNIKKINKQLNLLISYIGKTYRIF